ncbi:hypothetical protein J3Q64DRAFT_1866227 [Phycomyces blakesleeanus]|uniref:Uncharacterized protein n=2 Tax=Phycomyces blakesleeanus TaxID=4837 RepID=A0A162N5Y1_PHYB8|nr:hypothetical protein PHYBLDRAFT_175411 [Phycomyces blakesleeanus NRRL 1555(-)]OAD66114.1 hypothetical protein PHYBLDRAFT_175411 [Phycomyces blakesleeanus NRRL 1555(-)]|eukprot:XP_018284154.1 hypothetical protein PHYBLDRAFT_175411 [Phycomyces blakesleeanus NRRL 1555(-)]
MIGYPRKVISGARRLSPLYQYIRIKFERTFLLEVDITMRFECRLSARIPVPYSMDLTLTRVHNACYIIMVHLNAKEPEEYLNRVAFFNIVWILVASIAYKYSHTFADKMVLVLVFDSRIELSQIYKICIFSFLYSHQVFVFLLVILALLLCFLFWFAQGTNALLTLKAQL